MSYKYSLVGKKIGKLTVKGLVPKDKRPSQNHGNYWYCDCDCGTKDVMVPTTYLNEKSNYVQYSCGCDRRIKAFLASSLMGLTQEFVEQFDDFEKFLFIHKQLTAVSGKNASTYDLNDYKRDVLYFYNEKQFNDLYSFWKKVDSNDKTFYDWAKPSLDHKVPKSRGGSNDLDNLQFLTVFENLAKRDMTEEEWKTFKINTNTTSDYFIESILKEGGEAYYG